MTDLHPVTKPSRVNSPIDGDLSSSATPRHATSSSCTWISPRNFIAPSMPIPSGFSSGSSSRWSVSCGHPLFRAEVLTSITVKDLAYSSGCSGASLASLEITSECVSLIDVGPILRCVGPVMVASSFWLHYGPYKQQSTMYT